MKASITFEQLNEIQNSLIECQVSIEGEIKRLEQETMTLSVSLRKDYIKRIEANLEVIKQLMLEAMRNPCEVKKKPVKKSKKSKKS